MYGPRNERRNYMFIPWARAAMDEAENQSIGIW